VFLLLAALAAGCAANRPQKLWDASLIAGHPQPFVLVTNKPGGKVVAGVRTDDVRNMIAVKERVEDAAGELRTDLLVADSGDPNGYSFVYHGKPRIAVNMAMINLIGEDQDAMAALIGHELAHLYLDHAKQRQKREEERITTSAVLGFALGMIGIPMGPVDMATTTVTRKYSREDEREADNAGLDYMVRAGYDPCGAVRLHEKLGALSTDAAIPFMSTHPSSTERAGNMKLLAGCK
jgi:predicted Zn-dependent protease